MAMVKGGEKDGILWNIEVPLIVPNISTFSTKLENKLDEWKIF